MSIDGDQRDLKQNFVEIHKELIDNIWPELTNSPEIPAKNLLSTVKFQESVLYPEGIDIALWELEPASKLCITATSGEAFLVGGIWRNGATKDSFFYRLGYEGVCSRGDSYLEFYHNKNQQSVDELLFNWHLSYERNKRKKDIFFDLNSGTAKNEFLRLKEYRSYVEASYIWGKRTDLMNPLLFIVFRGMHNYYAKHWRLDENDPLIEWLHENNNLPESY